MTRTTKLTESLHWSSLKENFPIGMRSSEVLQRDKNDKIILVDGNPVVVKINKFANELQTAIDDGRIDALVAEAAKLYHAGDTQGVINALAKDVSSKRCHLKDMYDGSARHIDEIMLDTLDKYIQSRRTSATRTTDGLPQWAYGKTELDAIDDPAKLQKIINSINDVCCGKAGGSYIKYLGEDYLTVAKANREYARKRRAILLAKKDEVVVDPEILAKLSKTGKVTLTAEQAAAVMKLLNR